MRTKLILIAVVLAATLGLRSWLSAAPRVPLRQSLAQFPTRVGAWQTVSQEEIGQDVLDVLKADDYLLRTYRGPQGRFANFFIAYYRSQKAGDSMHSPKNCLPGAGWEPVMNDRISLGAGPDGNPMLVNRYVVEKQTNRDLVLYWYQAQGRIIASEYWGKFYLIWDAVSEDRRDGAIVRIIVPMGYGESTAAATAPAVALAHAVMPHLGAFLPN